MNVGELYRAHARVRPDHIALIQDGRRIDYATLDRRTNQVANALAALGVGAGDHVAVLVKNDFRFVESLFGALRLGAIVTPVTTRAHYEALAHVLHDCGAGVLIASRDFADEAQRLAAAVDGLAEIRVMDGAAGEALDYDRWREAAAETPVHTAADDDDVAILTYTAGSTGVPKGVLLTHGGLGWCATVVRKIFLLGPEDRCLIAVPMFHANGLGLGVMPMLECGGSMVILPDFDPGAVIRAIGRERCTYTTGVPAMFKLLLREEAALAETDLSALNFVICGSSEVPGELLSGFEARAGAPMLECFGLTEALVVLNNPRWGIRKEGTSGIPYPDVEIRITDPSDPNVDVPQGEIGELLVRSPAVTKGYHNLPEVTAERLLPGGWLRTRDLVSADRQGYVKIIGRQDDMINCGGESVYPKEVENILMGHPNVADVAVASRPDELKGEVPVAFVVEKAAGCSSPAALKEYFLANGPAYAHPRAVFILDEIPLTGAKKVDRAALKAMAGG